MSVLLAMVLSPGARIHELTLFLILTNRNHKTLEDRSKIQTIEECRRQEVPMLIKTAMACGRIGHSTALYGRKSGLYKMLPCICLFPGEKLVSNPDLHVQCSKTDGKNYYNHDV